VSNDVAKAPKSVVGQVVSNKMQKTVVVEAEWTIIHPKYKKVVRRTTRYMAHDEHGCGIGDRVQLTETRPLSKRKRWRVVSIVERSARPVPVREEPVAS
jgi:small subunit ribosomal protein S17